MGHVKKSEGRRFAPAGGDSREILSKRLNFAAIEQYKLIRENLDFTLPENERCPVIGVTSPMRSEGKSVTSINLSYVFAERESRVLLVDADLRIPTIAKKLEIDGTPGLTDLLRESNAELPKFQSLLLDNWFILPSGHIPPNPSELLGSGRMRNVLDRLREAFDYIIIDLPPINVVPDAVSVSGMISGMIVVVREDVTRKKELERCFRQLRLSNVNVLGCVMNAAKPEAGSYSRYRKYKYYQGEAKDAGP